MAAVLVYGIAPFLLACGLGRFTGSLVAYLPRTPIGRFLADALVLAPILSVFWLLASAIPTGGSDAQRV
ncbi:MAG: hypothetical protein AAGG09_15125 [Pseudomonadota bacterium]